MLSGDVADKGEADSYIRLRPVIDAALERFGAKLLVATRAARDGARRTSPPIWSTTPLSELVALRQPQRLASVIRGGATCG